MKFFVPILTSGGYVGLSIATLLSQHHKVMAVDIVPEKVELINSKKSPIQDEYIEKYLTEKELNLTATLDAKEAYSDADFVVIAAPTNYDSKKNFFDTSAVEAVIKLVIEYNPEAIMVIKSTIPVPSFHPEGISNVLLEGAACARPLITTDHAGCQETVTDGVTGYIVKQRNSKDLIDKMIRFIKLSYEEKVQMGIEGRKKVEKEYDRKIVVDCSMKEIEELGRKI